MSKRKVNNYTLEFKQSSTKLAATSDQSISQTVKDLGINLNTLHGQVNKYYPDTKASEIIPASNAEAELKQLKKELARVKQERDRLKKAMAYFASEAA